jgi:glycosyltransferase involved in cell wall biosynthesis
VISVMIPALNEEKHLKNTVNDIVEASAACNNLPLDIIIVNDGSTDKTAEVIRELEEKYSFIKPIHNEKNLGIGKSLKKAIKIAQYEKFIVITGDNDLSKELIIDLFKSRDKADLIISYYSNKNIRGFFRNSVSFLYCLVYQLAFGVKVKYINGSALYPTEKVRELKLISNRFSIIAELTVKLIRSGCSYHEVSGLMKNNASESNAISIRNTVEVFTTFIKLLIGVRFKKEK